MANSSGASSTDKTQPKEREDVKKSFYISLYFDGTWNKKNTQQETAEQVRCGNNDSTVLTQQDTNVAVLSELAVDTKLVGTEIIKLIHPIYIEGPGTAYDKVKGEELDETGLWDKIKNNVLDQAGGLIAGGVGVGSRGVVDKVSRGVSKAYNYLVGQSIDWSKDEIHFSVYGFSRGAACARMFAYLVAREKSDATLTFEEFMADYLFGSAKNLMSSKRCEFLEKDGFDKKKCQVDFLGLFDTVSSIGLADETAGILYTHQLNVTDFGLYSPTLDRVKCTLHIGAIDEFRKNFAVTDVGKNVDKDCAEIFVPGCHADIGGGYADNEESEICLHTEIDDMPTYILTDDPRNDIIRESVSEESLVKLGWATPKGTSTSLVRKIISSKRTVKRGISNVTLKTMWKMANETIGPNQGCRPFDDYKCIKDFLVPQGLNHLDSLVNGSLPAKGKRTFIIPGGSLSSEEYKKLRFEYVHSETDDSWGTELVQGANWKDRKLCRIVYHGDKGDNDRHYMQDL